MKRRHFCFSLCALVLAGGGFSRLLAQTPPKSPYPKDSPPPASEPPVYRVPPIITALAFSPDGSLLAVSGYRETVLHKPDGSGIVARLLGRADRIESLAFSADGKYLGVAGGAPARYGEAQLWDIEKRALLKAVEVAPDSLFGVSFSPDGKSLGFGGADNAVRIVSVPEGKLKLKFDNHSDWTLSTAWTKDSKHILSTGRDRAIKLIVAETGSFVDDINTHTSAYRAMARHPKEDQTLVAGDDGMPRLYQIFRSTPRTMNQEDHNLLRSYDKQPGQINALAFSADGTQFAVGGEFDVINVFHTDNGGVAAPDKPILGGKPFVTLRGHKGTIHAIAFHPNGKQIAVGGFDGLVRLYELPSGKLLNAFSPAPLAPNEAKAKNAK